MSFESMWDRVSGIMDRAVDTTLGDRIRYRHKGVWLGEGDPAMIPGFIIDETQAIGFDEVDETLGLRKRVKVAKSLIDMPAREDRIEHPRLGAGSWQPAGTLPETQGRYWIFDVQKVS